MPKRTREEIVTEYLRKTKDHPMNNQGKLITKSGLMKAAGTNWPQHLRYLGALVETGNLEKIEGDRKTNYRITRKGKKGLETFEKTEPIMKEIKNFMEEES